MIVKPVGSENIHGQTTAVFKVDGLVKFMRSTQKTEIKTGKQRHEYTIVIQLKGSQLPTQSKAQTIASKKQNIKAMLATGNIKAQIITAIKNFSVKKKKEIEELRRNSLKLFILWGETSGQ